MTAISGFGGHVGKGNAGGGGEVKIPCVRNWGVNYTAQPAEAVCSASDGAKIRSDGITDWTGQYDAYGALPSIFPGDTFEFGGAISGVGSAAIGVAGDAMVEQVVINIPIGEAGIINHQVSFGAVGALRESSLNVPVDDTIPSAPSARGLKVEIATADPYTSFSEMPDVQSVTITMSRANQSYSSSSTSGRTARTKGPLDVQVSIPGAGQLVTGWSGFPNPNAVIVLRCFTRLSPDEYWLLKFMRVAEKGGLEVDIETAAIVGYTLNAALSAFELVSGSPTKGVITKPGGGNVWG